MNRTHKKTLLLVEDEAVTAMMEKTQLEHFGYCMETALTGEDAIRTVLSRNDIDLILMDIDLGSGIDGTDTAEHILNEKDIPIVFLSSHTEPEIVDKTEKITSYGYVVKNSATTVLDASIKMAFKLFAEKMNVKMHQEKLTSAYEDLQSTNEELIQTNEQLEESQQEILKREKELRESEEKFRLLFENSDLLVTVYDRNGILQLMNRKVASLFNGKPEDFVGIFIEELNPVSGKIFLQRIRKAIDMAKSADYEDEIMFSNGTRWFFSRVHPIPDAKGEYHTAQIMSLDITKRKSVEKTLTLSEKRLKAAQLIAKMGDFTWDLETGHVTFSEALYEMLKYDKNEKIDYEQVNKEIYHPDDLDSITWWINECIASGSKELPPNEYRLIRKDGEIIHVRTSGVIEYRDGKPVSVFAFIQDITAKKQPG